MNPLRIRSVCSIRILSSTIATPFSSPSRRLCGTPSNISAALIKELREQTGAPMMECKKALSDKEVNGNISKAIDWLRAKGIAKATSTTNRISAEGLIGIYQRNLGQMSENTNITLVEVNSETDFVGRNSDFQKFVTSVTLTTNQLPENGELNVEKVLDCQIVNSSSPMTLKQILGDITTAIR